MCLGKLKDTGSIYRSLLYFYILAVKNMKMNLRKEIYLI